MGLGNGIVLHNLWDVVNTEGDEQKQYDKKI